MKKTAKKTVAIVECTPIDRMGLEIMLRSWPRGRLLFSARDGLEYEALCAEHGVPELVVMELDLPNRDGWELLEWMKDHQQGTRSIVITRITEAPRIHRARLLGANAILGKEATQEDLMRALDDVALVGHHQNALLENLLALAGTPWSEVEPDQPYLERLERILTRKEYRILVRWTQQPLRTSQQLARDMKLSPKTVQAHVSSIYRKLGQHTRADLVLLAHTWGVHRRGKA